jgi:hypothetical protein
MSANINAFHPRLSRDDALLDWLPRANAIIHLAMKGRCGGNMSTRCKEF